MKHFTIRHSVGPIALALALALVSSACEKKQEVKRTNKFVGGVEDRDLQAELAPTDVVSLPGNLFSDTPLENALPLSYSRDSVAAGTAITFRGVVAGRAEPFTEGRAVMLVSDEGLPLCDPEECKTPWDACCETPESIASQTATIQVVDADGRPMKLGLQGEGNLQPGIAVQVEGIVGLVGEGFFVVNATQIHVPPAVN